MPPHPAWYDGREAILIASAKGFDPEFGELRTVSAARTASPPSRTTCGRRARRVPAAGLDVLRIEDGRVAEITSFVTPELFPAFGLPPALAR